jgi:hypothetical protein
LQINEILSIVTIIIIATIVALFVVKKFRKIPHKTLTRLVAANIILDIVAIAFWAAFPASQWTIYRLDFLVVGVEAAAAVALFAITLFGLKKTKKWAPMLAIAITVTQRIFATYVFFPSEGIIITLIWSLLIIYFAYMTIKRSGQA